MEQKKKRILVLVSGGGTNLQALIDAQKSGVICSGEIIGVLSSKPGVYAIERAHNAGIECGVLDRELFDSRQAYSDALLERVAGFEPDLIILAGFMCILGEKFVDVYRNRIINVHPALIPSFCGEGFFGLRVHEAALKKGVKVSGATVHFVTGVTDGGPIILQKAVYVEEDDTPKTLQERIMREAEWKILPEAAELFCEGRLHVSDGKVKIDAK